MKKSLANLLGRAWVHEADVLEEEDDAVLRVCSSRVLAEYTREVATWYPIVTCSVLSAGEYGSQQDVRDSDAGLRHDQHGAGDARGGQPAARLGRCVSERRGRG